MKINIGCGWRNFGKEWIHIGDKLYHFYTGEINDKELIVTPYQFKFLIDLLKPAQPH